MTRCIILEPRRLRAVVATRVYQDARTGQWVVRVRDDVLEYSVALADTRAAARSHAREILAAATYQRNAEAFYRH